MHSVYRDLGCALVDLGAPLATLAHQQFPTWAQCGGKNNNFNANGKTCRDADECEH